MGNRNAVEELSQQLRRRYPQSPQAERLDRGQFDE
jgi:Tfp pilus assembly protein PilF